MAKDMNGQELNKGDQVAFPIGFGNIAPAVIEEVSSSIVTPTNQQGFPHLVVAIRMHVQIQPNGVAPGIIRLGPPDPPVKPHPEG